jgi:hypothetical protein
MVVSADLDTPSAMRMPSKETVVLLILTSGSMAEPEVTPLGLAGSVTRIDHAANGLLMRTPRISSPSFKSSVYNTATPDRAAATTTNAS